MTRLLFLQQIFSILRRCIGSEAIVIYYYNAQTVWIQTCTRAKYKIKHILVITFRLFISSSISLLFLMSVLSSKILADLTRIMIKMLYTQFFKLTFRRKFRYLLLQNICTYLFRAARKLFSFTFLMFFKGLYYHLTLENSKLYVKNDKLRVESRTTHLRIWPKLQKNTSFWKHSKHIL